MLNKCSLGGANRRSVGPGGARSHHSRNFDHEFHFGEIVISNFTETLGSVDVLIDLSEALQGSEKITLAPLRTPSHQTTSLDR